MDKTKCRKLRGLTCISGKRTGQGVEKENERREKGGGEKKGEKINDYDTADDNMKTVDVLLVMTGS